MSRAVFRFTTSVIPGRVLCTSRAMLRLVPALALIAAACSGSSSPTAPTYPALLANVTTARVELQSATLESLQNANWDCQQRVPGLISCAPPGIGLAPIPPLGENGRPVHRILVFTLDGTPFGSAFFIRPDLYHGQTCEFTGQPFVFRPIIGYYECFRVY